MVRLTQKRRKAAMSFIRRQNRTEHPDGKSVASTSQAWYPSEKETCECCSSIRTPSRKYPWSLMVHCRTMKHVANLYGIEESVLRECVKRVRKEMKKGEENAY